MSNTKLKLDRTFLEKTQFCEIKFIKKMSALLFLGVFSASLMPFNLMACAIEAPIKSTSQINDSVIPAFSNNFKKNYNMNELKNYLDNSKAAKNDLINLQHNFNAFPEGAKINLTLNNIEIPSALKIIAKEGGKNIVIDQSVKGLLTAELKNISLNEAMKIILISEELETRIEGNTIFVASRSIMSKKGLNRKYVKAFKLNNSNASEIAQILEASVFNKGYKINEDASSGSVPAMQAVEVSPATTEAKTVTAGSSSGQSLLGDSKIIKGRVEELNPGEGFGDAKILASQLKIQSNKASTKDIAISNNDGGAIVIPDTRTNSVLVAGLQEDILMAETAIKYLDKPLDQVAIEVSLIEVSKDNTNDLGITTSGSEGNINGIFNATGNSYTYQTLSTLADNIKVTLNALVKNDKAKLLANPTIISLDNSEALIKITDQVVSKMDVIVTTTSTSYSVTLADVGIVLNILPKIGDNGYVTMRIRPSITTPLVQKDVGSFGAFVTPISTREVLIQEVRVKSGETLAIAGIIRESDLESIGKVPLVGDIPVFGTLFKNKTYNHRKTELVILITPKIIQATESN